MELLVCCPLPVSLPLNFLQEYLAAKFLRGDIFYLLSIQFLGGGGGGGGGGSSLKFSLETVPNTGSPVGGALDFFVCEVIYF